MNVRYLCTLLAVLLLAPLCAQEPPREQPKPRAKAPSTIKLAAEGEAANRIVEGTVSTLGSDQPLKNFRLMALARFDDGANRYADFDSDDNAAYRIELGKSVTQLRVFAYGDFVIPDSWSNIPVVSMKFEKAEKWDIKVRPNIKVTLSGTVSLSTTGKPIDNGCAVYLAPLDVRQDGSMRVFDEPLPTRCDEKGRYEFKAPAGFYRLWAVWTDRSDGRWIFCSGFVARVELFRDTVKDVTIAPGPQIVGRVSDARDGSPVVARMDLYTNAFLRQLNNTNSDGEFRDDEAAEGDPILPAGEFRIRLYNVDPEEFAAILRPRMADGAMRLERGLRHSALKGKRVEWKLYNEDDIVVDVAVQTADMQLPVHGADIVIEANRLDDPSISHLRAAFELRSMTNERGVARFVGLWPGDYSVYFAGRDALLGNLRITADRRQQFTLNYSLPFAAGTVRYPDNSVCNNAICQVDLELPEGGLRGPFYPDPFSNRLLKDKGLAVVPLTYMGATFKLRFYANSGNQVAPDMWTPSQYPWRTKEVVFKVDAEKAYTFDVTLERAENVPEPKAEAAPMLKGEFWYRMEDAQGRAQGFARLVVKTHDDGQRLEWEMKLTHDGGRLEEERVLAIDKERRLVSASYSADGKLVCEGTRSGGKVSGRRSKDGKLEPFEVATPDNALPSLGLLLAATMPLSDGEIWTRRELDEGNAFADRGEVKFALHKDTLTWEGKEIACWRVDVTKAGDETGRLTLWVSGAREIVRVNWGGVVQVLSREPTRHLYKRPGDGK